MSSTSTFAPEAHNEPDAAILEAWERRKAASRAYNALPFEEYVDIEGAYSPEEKEVLAIIDAAEEEIRSSIATTPRGVAIQLWVALHHLVTSREDDAAANEADLDYFERQGDQADWNARMLVAAIKSLQAMGG